jgi:hypothetical protein
MNLWLGWQAAPAFATLRLTLYGSTASGSGPGRGLADSLAVLGNTAQSAIDFGHDLVRKVCNFSGSRWPAAS